MRAREEEKKQGKRALVLVR